MCLYATITGMLMKNIEIITYQNSIIKKLKRIGFDGIIVESKEMQQIMSVIESIARFGDFNSFRWRQTGTGKIKLHSSFTKKVLK